MSASRPAFAVAGHEVAAGHRRALELPLARTLSGTAQGLPVIVVHGRGDGPAVWLSAAVHGDELCGIEIIRRVLAGLDPRHLAGTVVAVPVVNVFGFNTGDRYLPDRRDLNRAFPGSPRGSLAARVAHLFSTEVVARCSVGIDLHTGSDRRTNLPQIRGDLDDERTLALARAFGAPVAVHAGLRAGSLRQAATEAGATVLLYEGGEAARFDERAIVAGEVGVRRVLATLGMTADPVEPGPGPALARSTRWVRAGRSGILHLDADLGEEVVAGQVLGDLHDPGGARVGRVRAPDDGLLIGLTRNPLVHRGDAVAHVARLEPGPGPAATPP